MIAKRIAALAATVALILGAMLIRDRLIEGDGNDVGPATDPVEATELVCATELAEVCRSVDTGGLTVRIEEAGVTLDALASADATDTPVWMTFAPFPDAVDLAASRPGETPTFADGIVLASSTIVLVATPDTAADLGAECGEPVHWRCLGEAGRSVGFASEPRSAIGLIGATTTAAGYGGSFADSLFQVWMRNLLRSVNRTQLSTGTAVATIQVRPSAMSVAVGAEAELSDERRDRFTVLYAEPMGRADVILAVPEGADVPGGLADELAAALTDQGWSPAGTADGTPPDPGALLATRDFWRNL